MMKTRKYLLLGCFLLTFGLYALTAGESFRRPSRTPYFIDLADAFLHGRMDITEPSTWGYDLIWYQERWYVAQQPLPALLLAPWVTVAGKQAVSDIAAGVFLGALSAALGCAALAAWTPGIDRRRLICLTACFAFGTVHYYLSVMGTVWFLGQITTTVFVWGLLLMLWRKRFFWAGVMAAIIIMGRPSVLPGAVVLGLGWIALCERHNRKGRRQAVLFLRPLLVGCLLLGLYNWRRFGNMLDMGYAAINEAPDIKERFLAHGNFSLAFLPENLFIAMVKPPQLHSECLGSDCGLIQPDPIGMGQLWTTPIILYGLLACYDSGEEGRQNRLLALTTGCVLLPSLLYHNTGSAQFGYRFALDALPFGFLLVARGARRGRFLPLAAVTIWCIIVNVWGTQWFMRFLNP
jgi:hypothetical protein